MSKAIPKIDDLHPDGVCITVAWDDMLVNMSVFVPCVNTDEAKKQSEKIAARRGWKVYVQPRIENEKFGVRIWRTL